MNPIKIFTLTLLLTFGLAHVAAQSVGINETGSLPNSKAILDISSTSKGLLVPRLSSVERMAISATSSEEGLIVFDTDQKAYYYYTGSNWKDMSNTLWTEGAQGIHRLSNIGINVDANEKYLVFASRPFGDTGADSAAIYGYRAGEVGNQTGGGGTSITRTGIDAAIKGFSNYGNPYSAAVAGYAWMDYNNSIAVYGGTPNATTYGILGYRNNSGTLYSGYFVGKARFEGDIGIGKNPSFRLDVSNSTRAIGINVSQSYESNLVTNGIQVLAVNSGVGATRGVSSICTGAGNFAFYGLGKMYLSDKLGIGISSPNEYLEIAGNGRMFIGDGGGVARRGLLIDAVEAGDYVRVVPFDYGQNSNMELYLPSNVNIGAPTGAAGYKLSVNGKIMAEELKVQLSGSWPDYVFNEEYALLSIPELEKSIIRDGHLPGMSPASEVEANGFEVGEMNRILLEKVEELTLYIIQQNKRLDTLSLKIIELQNKN